MTLSYDAIVTGLELAGVPHEKAVLRARLQLGLTPAPDPVSARDASILEKTEQLEVSKRFRVCGFMVRSTSQARASKVAPGLPDLIITHRALPIFLFWETKKQVGGKYSDAQLEFKADCERCGVPCLGGDRYDAERYLVEIGRAYISPIGTFEVIPV